MINTLSGTTPFVKEVDEGIKDIVKDPDIMFDLWIMRTWNVLPTDERFQNLTREHKMLLWEDYLLQNPQIAKKIEDSDPEFEKEWESLEGEIDSLESDYEEDEDVIAEKFEEFVKEKGLDMELKPGTLEILKSKAPEFLADDDEWEEVE